MPVPNIASSESHTRSCCSTSVRSRYHLGPEIIGARQQGPIDAAKAMQDMLKTAPNALAGMVGLGGLVALQEGGVRSTMLRLKESAPKSAPKRASDSSKAGRGGRKKKKRRKNEDTMPATPLGSTAIGIVGANELGLASGEVPPALGVGGVGMSGYGARGISAEGTVSKIGEQSSHWKSSGAVVAPVPGPKVGTKENSFAKDAASALAGGTTGPAQPLPWFDGIAGVGSQPSSTRGLGIHVNENDHLARFADSLLFSPTAASMGAAMNELDDDSKNPAAEGEAMQDIASYFNLPSPLPSLTPPGAASGPGYAFSFDNIPQGPGRINPLVAAAFVNPGRSTAAFNLPHGARSSERPGDNGNLVPEVEQEFRQMIQEQEKMNQKARGLVENKVPKKRVRKQPPPKLSIPL